MSHTLSMTIDGGMLMHPKVACTEPPEADCHLVSGCECERWSIERDDQGPFHLVTEYRDDDTEADVKHRMTHDPATCHVRDWLDNGDDTTENGTDPVEVVIPFEPVWEGDFYTWKPLVKTVSGMPGQT